MSYKLSINTGFAVNRYVEPEVWIKIVGHDLDLRNVQLTADMLNPSLPDKIISKQISKINTECDRYNVRINSTFTGAFTRVNHLAHPDQEVRDYWVDWFKRYVDITVELKATSMGSHFGIFSMRDDRDPELREERRAQNIQGWHEIARYAKSKGLEYLSWEPMSISREQGETLQECQRLQEDVNKGSPLPFKICLDVDHGDVSSPLPADTDPYSWLEKFAEDSPLIHLKQSLKSKGGHYPFLKEFNEQGKIEGAKVLRTLHEKGNTNAELILEHSFREREPADSTVVETLKESVNYWKESLEQCTL